MSISTIADITTSLNTYKDHLHNLSKTMHEGLMRYHESDRGLGRCSQAKLDENGSFSIDLPALKFSCLSSQRIAFKEDYIVSETDFYILKKEGEISVLKCHINIDGCVKLDDGGDDIDIYHDPYLPSKILGRLFRAASGKMIISV